MVGRAIVQAWFRSKSKIPERSSWAHLTIGATEAETLRLFIIQQSGDSVFITTDRSFVPRTWQG